MATLRGDERQVVLALARRGWAVDALALRTLRAGRSRIARVDWQALSHGARRRVEPAARVGKLAAATAGELAAASSKRVAAVGGAAVTALESQARTVRRDFSDTRWQTEATRLNEQAAGLRQQGSLDRALEVAHGALEIFRALGDRRGEALTLNGIGLTRARMGDETGALDSYETAVDLLTGLGDSHSAGRVLANMGALERGQGRDEQARAYLHDALERLEPGSVEHDRTAQQLRRAG